MSAPSNGVRDGLPMPQRAGAVAAVAFGVSLSVLDAVIVNVALPTISLQLSVAEADSIWIVNAYQLATIVSLLSFSALGDLWGYRRIYLVGLTVFTLASAGCMLASGFASLVFMRAVQGLGAAAVTSVNTTLIRTIYPARHLGRGMGINATVVAVSSVAGPTVAAAILSAAEWPWLFALNIPIGIAAFLLSRRFLPDNPVKIRDRRFDWRDGAMNALTFGLFILSIGGLAHGLDRRILLFGAVLCAAVGGRFVRTQLHKPYPLLPFDLLRIPIFSMSIATSVCSYLSQMLAMVALPFFLQQECGRSAVATGLLMTAWPMVTVVAAPLAGMLVERIHAGVLGGVGLAVMAAGILLTALLPGGASDGGIVWRLLLCGAGFGLFQSPNNSVLIASAPRERSGSASGMLAMARLLGQTAGAALVALLFHLAPADGSRFALFTAAAVAAAAAAVSFSRLSLALPAGMAPGRRP